MALKGDGRTEEDVSHSLFGHLPPVLRREMR